MSTHRILLPLLHFVSLECVGVCFLGPYLVCPHAHSAIQANLPFSHTFQCTRNFIVSFAFSVFFCPKMCSFSHVLVQSHSHRIASHSIELPKSLACNNWNIWMKRCTHTCPPNRCNFIFLGNYFCFVLCFHLFRFAKLIRSIIPCRPPLHWCSLYFNLTFLGFFIHSAFSLSLSPLLRLRVAFFVPMFKNKIEMLRIFVLCVGV